MRVIAAPDMKVPKEDAPRSYITGDAPQTVPESYYYLRRLADGDLLRLTDEEPAGASPLRKNAVSTRR